MIVYHASDKEFDEFDVSLCQGQVNGSLIVDGVNVNPDLNVAEYYVEGGCDFLYECRMSDNIKLLDWEEGAAESPLAPEKLISVWYGPDIHRELTEALDSAERDGDLDSAAVATQLLLGDQDWIAENEMSSVNMVFDYDDWLAENYGGVHQLDVSTVEWYGKSIVRDAQHRFGKVEGLNWLYDKFDISGISHINVANGVYTEHKTSVLWSVSKLKILECTQVLDVAYHFGM